jgi:hypothetical protein
VRTRVKDATIVRTATIRMIGRNMRFQLVTVVLAALLAFPATAAAVQGSTAEPRGLPFSMSDLGWLAFGAMLLLVLALVLQGIARHRRASRGAGAVAVAPRRTEP